MRLKDTDSTSRRLWTTPWVLYLLLLIGTWYLFRGGIQPGFSLPLGDFVNYFAASKVVMAEQPLEEAYLDFLWFQRRIDQLGIPGQLGAFVPHPPPAALLMIPFTFLDALTAKQVWTLFGLVFLACVILLLNRLTGTPPGLIYLLALLSGPALWHCLAFGQLYLLLVFSLVAHLYFQSRGRPVLAGVTLGFLIPIKYVGALWVAYWAWRRQWKLVASAAGAAGLVVAMTLAVAGPEPFVWFWHHVLPRHLQGEIQDPFAVRFQSWHSLLRRLFVFDTGLNPEPALNAPWLFAVLRTVLPATVMAGAIAAIVCGSGQGGRDARLDSAWLLWAVLAASPATASYHFLLLLPAAVFWISHLQATRRTTSAVIMLIFGAVSLPHYLYLEKLASGWWNLIAFSRLWLLMLLGWMAFRRLGLNRPDWRRTWMALVAACLLVSGLGQWMLHAPLQLDPARRVKVPGIRPNGLILEEPNASGPNLIFTATDRAGRRYAPMQADGRPLPTPSGAGYYHPQLHADHGFLVESWNARGPELWRTGRSSDLILIANGGSGVWVGRDRVAYLAGDAVRLGPSHSPAAGAGFVSLMPRITGDGRIEKLAASPEGQRLYYCRLKAQRCKVYAYDLESRQEVLVADVGSPARSPAVSPGGEQLALSIFQDGNWDIWVMELEDRSLRRVTRHPAMDTQPAWLSDQSLVFASDRGRGPSFFLLYTVQLGPG